MLSLPVMVALRRRYPKAILTMLVAPPIRPLVEDHPDLDAVMTDDAVFSGIAGFFRFVRALREDKFDAALLLHPTLRLAAALALARIPIRVGTGYRAYSFLFNRRVKEHRKFSARHEAEFNLSLAAKLDAPVEPVAFHLTVQPDAAESVSRILEELNIATRQPLVVIHPGSRGSARDWPLDRFVKLADRFVREKRAAVIVTGGGAEKMLVDKFVRQMAEKAYPFAGRLDLKELIALLARADLMVANSTGPLHIAAALDTRVIGLYPPLRPASARRWGPWTQIENTLTARHDECGRCDPKCQDDCMTTISVEDVWQKAERIL